VYALGFDDFDATEFEAFCFELLRGLPGFHNVDWRKGTPKSTSPADRGRDIAADVDHIEVDGARHVETWFIAWSQAERPDVALVIASGFLSNASKDHIKDYVQNNRPPFRIKYWERPTLDELARTNRELLQRFFLSSTPFEPSDAEHIVQCELAGCVHPAIYAIDGDPDDTAQGWCDLCRAVASQQEEELMALGALRTRSRNAEGPRQAEER
jgi:hypothetical protein